MQKTNEMCDKLIKDFTENYMEKLFYFCLKKTGKNSEADDLTQDIALQIITALKKGTVPTQFSAWIWQIARNRYSVWAKAKHNRGELVTGFDIGDYEIESEEKNALEKMIHTEEMALLRRELAFAKSEYRNIIVAYYIENKSVRNIALSLSLSETAVKQRLFRARQILKEGMDMAREFGKLSYRPENIDFIMNGCSSRSGEPEIYISRALCKNIMIASYRTPATAEELAVEAGVALPYIEEELKALTEATLMKKNGNKYETNFFIVSAEAQEKIYAHLKDITPELTKAIIEAMEYDIEWRNTNCPKWHDGFQPFEDMKWALLMEETDKVCFATLKPFNKNADDVPNIGSWGHTIRPNGGEWDVLGMEIYNGEKPKYVGLSGCVSSPDVKDLTEIWFRQFHFKCFGLEKRTFELLAYTDGRGLLSVADGNSEEVNESVLNRLENCGYIKKTDVGYVPAIMVMRKEKMHAMPKDVWEKYKKLRAKACDIATKHYLFCRELNYREIPDFLKDDEFQIEHACVNIFAIRGAVLEEAVRQNYLSFDKDNDKQTLGAYLLI